jgi:CBS domain containing-hemolysin-like protein
MLQLLGGVPEKGAGATIGAWNATVESTEGRKVKHLRLRRRTSSPP